VARFLALDWDHRELHLVSADLKRGRVHVERAVSWIEDMALTPENAEDFGKRLRLRLKEANIAVAPLIVGLGRDRFVAKEVRFPQVSPDVEVALVRNQIVKDLTEAPDDVLLDYFPLKAPGKNGERRALSAVIRKDLTQSIQTAAKAAGLKLASITARPFGVAATVNRLAGTVPQIPAPPEPEAVVGVLTATAHWAEFSAIRGDQMVFTRSVAVGDALLGEIRRNLAAYAGQPQLTFPRDALQALYVAGDGENAVLREKLLEILGIPVYGLDPFAGDTHVQVPPEGRAGFTGAVGLLYLWATTGATPVNFVKPREAKPVANPTKRRFVVYGVLGAAAAGLAAFLIWQFLQGEQEKIALLRKHSASAKKTLTELQPEIKYTEALADWTGGAIPWLDELYDLTARMQFKKGFRITQVNIATLAAKTAKEREKDKEKVIYSARMMIDGKVQQADLGLVQDLVKKISLDPHCKAELAAIKAEGSAADPKKTGMTFTIRVDLAHQAMVDYRIPLNLAPGALPAAPAAVEPDEPDEIVPGQNNIPDDDN